MKKAIFFIIYITSTLLGVSQSPTFQWAKSMGGNSYERSFSITADVSGNVYTTGSFLGTVDFNPGPGIFNLTSTGIDGIFISKLDASGNFVWAKQFEMTPLSQGESYSIKIDPNGNIYTAGFFDGTTDFDPNAGIFNLTSSGSGGLDMFVSKLDASGNFVWAKNISHCLVSSIAVDPLQNIFVTGSFAGSVDFDSGVGTFNLTSTGSEDMFILRLNISGDFVWAKNMVEATSSDYSVANSIGIDASDNIYTAGNFKNTVDFDPGAGTFNLTSMGSNTDVFISKIDSTGNFLWAKQIGGAAPDDANSIAINTTGDICVIGDYVGTVDFDPGAGVSDLTNFATGYDIFVLKLDTSGNFIWAKEMGGTSFDQGHFISLDAIGNVYTTGSFSGIADFDPSGGVFNLTSDSANTTDIFISKLDASGNFVWAGNMGGKSDDDGNSIVVDASNNIYSVGTFQSTGDFDPTAGTTNLTSVGSYDVFVHKMSQTPSGINESMNETNFTLYPNPASNFIDVEVNLNEYTISIIDVTGKVVLKERTSQNKTRIDLSSFSDGIYFILLQSNDKMISKKFIKQ